MHAQHLGQLIDHDHQPDARLETGQNRVRNEISDEAQSQNRGQRQEAACDQRQGGSRRHQLSRAAAGSDAGQFNAGEKSDGRGGADA